MNVTVNKHLIQHQFTLIGLVFNTALIYSYWVSYHNAYQGKAIPISNTNYNCHITAVEFVKPIKWVHIIPYHATSLVDGHTCKHTYTYRHPHRNNFKEPRSPGLKNAIVTHLFTWRILPQV